jgi:four helix bundle protein
LAKQFPKQELFNLCHQIRKAADSVNLNIAEGYTGQSNAEFKRFLDYSLRSVVEVISCLFLTKKKGYMGEEPFKYFYEHYETLAKMITKLKDSLK